MDDYENYGPTVTYTFVLPRDRNEKKLFDLNDDMFLALRRIDEKCRGRLKWAEDENLALDKFCEEIRHLIPEGIHELD